MLSATIFLFFYLLMQTELYTTSAILGVLIIYQVFALVRFVERTNRTLSRFLDAVKYSDFSQSYDIAGLGSSFNELKIAFAEVIKKFQATRKEKEENFQYLQTVIQHIGIGLISFDPAGEIGLVNNAAKRLFRSRGLRNLNALRPFSDELVDGLLAMRPGQRSVFKVRDGDDLLQLVVYATEFKLRGQKFTLVSLQDIQSELEEKEMESWQNLIRVLTHEIMNSVTPISSLASTAKELLDDQIQPDDGSGGDSAAARESLADIGKAVGTIQKRSQGLLHFVDNYRNLTRVPSPDFQVFPVSVLFDQVKSLMEPSIAETEVDFDVSVSPSSLELTADIDLVEQVIINLLVNGIHALNQRENSKLEMKAFLNDKGRVIIQVVDNGPGIVPEVLDRIFIPFFTTKQDGSGIGLSLARQIMRLHGGSISVQSKLNEQTVFTLRF